MSFHNLPKLDASGDGGGKQDEEEVKENPSPESERDRQVELNAIHNANNALILKLPRELLSYIVKWVVSNRLDIVSLGRLALVCKDFNFVSQEPSLWHAMCQRVWGKAVLRKPFHSWQTHFIQRPHVHVHGVYISRTSYVRTGDASLSLTYKPYHYVEYFRILRFFPNGEVLMLTTPQDPREIVPKLETKNKKVQGLLLGRYMLEEETDQGSAIVRADLQTYYTPKDGTRLHNSRNCRSNRNLHVPTSISIYRMELRLTSTSPRKKFNKLTWTHHSCYTTYPELGKESTSTFDISRQYPALFFNRMKSFTAESYRPV